jgi:hypothetical protein
MCAQDGDADRGTNKLVYDKGGFWVKQIGGY